MDQAGKTHDSAGDRPAGRGRSHGAAGRRAPARDESAGRRSPVPGYDRERDPTATTQIGLNLFGMPAFGAAIGAGVGAEMDATVLGAGAGAAGGLLVGLAVIRLYSSRPMGK